MEGSEIFLATIPAN